MSWLKGTYQKKRKQTVSVPSGCSGTFDCEARSKHPLLYLHDRSRFNFWNVLIWTWQVWSRLLLKWDVFSTPLIDSFQGMLGLLVARIFLEINDWCFSNAREPRLSDLNQRVYTHAVGIHLHKARFCAENKIISWHKERKTARGIISCRLQ